MVDKFSPDPSLMPPAPEAGQTQALLVKEGDGPGRKFTTKQMGDACEMLVAAELTLAGIPALKVPDNWPHYDVVAQPLGTPAQRISVKSRTYKTGAAFVHYRAYDLFDWLAIVLLAPDSSAIRQIYLVPRHVADQRARRDKPTSKTAQDRYFRLDEVERVFSAYRDNFVLAGGPSDGAADASPGMPA